MSTTKWTISNWETFRSNVQHEYDGTSKTLTLTVTKVSNAEPEATEPVNLAENIWDHYDQWYLWDMPHVTQTERNLYNFIIIFKYTHFNCYLARLFDCSSAQEFHLKKIIFGEGCDSEYLGRENVITRMCYMCKFLEECTFETTLSTEKTGYGFCQENSEVLDMFGKCEMLEKLDLSLLTFGKKDKELVLTGIASDCYNKDEVHPKGLKEFHFPKINTPTSVTFYQSLINSTLLERVYFTQMNAARFQFNEALVITNKNIKYVEINANITNNATVLNIQYLFPNNLKAFYDVQNPLSMSNLNGKLCVFTNSGESFQTEITLEKQPSGRAKDYQFNNTQFSNRLSLFNFGKGDINSADEMVYYQNYVNGILSGDTATYTEKTFESLNGDSMKLASISNYDNKAINYEFVNCTFKTGLPEMFMNESVLSVHLDSYCKVSGENAFEKTFATYMITSCVIDCFVRLSNTSSMFSGSSSLTNVNIRNITLYGNVNVSYMFNGCQSLTTIPVFNIENAISFDATAMLKSCTKLTMDIDLEGHFPEVRQGDIILNSMFYGCNNISRIILPTLDTAGRVDISNIFRSTNLSHIVINKIRSQELIANDLMLNSSETDIRTIKIATRNCWYKEKTTEIGSENKLYLTKYRTDSSLEPEIVYEFPFSNRLKTFSVGEIDYYIKAFYNDANPSIIYNLEDFITASTESGAIEIRDSVCTVTLQDKQIESQPGGRISLKGNEGKIDPIETDTIVYIFENCLFKYGLSNLFEDCTRITSVSLNNCSFGMNVSSTTSDEEVNMIITGLSESLKMTCSGCSKLNNFVIKNPTQYRPNKDQQLLPYSNMIVTSNLTSLFNGCTALSSVDLSTIHLVNDANLTQTFRNCMNLNSITKPRYDSTGVTSDKVTSINYTETFYNCINLVSHSFGTELQVDNGEIKFIKTYFCEETSTGNIQVDFDKPIVCQKLTITSMFSSNCAPREFVMPEIDVNTLNINNMFDGSDFLDKFTLKSITADDVIDLSRLFNNCTRLQYFITETNARFTINKSDPESTELCNLILDNLCSSCYMIKTFNLPVLHDINYNISMKNMLSGLKSQFEGFKFDITTETGIENIVDLTEVLKNSKNTIDPQTFTLLEINIDAKTINLTSAFKNSSIKDVIMKLIGSEYILDDMFSVENDKTVVHSLELPLTDVVITDDTAKIYNTYTMSDIFLARTISLEESEYKEIYFNNNEPTWFIDDVTKFTDTNRFTYTVDGDVVTIIYDNVVVRNMKGNIHPSITLYSNEGRLPDYGLEKRYHIIFRNTVIDHGMMQMFQKTEQIESVTIEDTCTIKETVGYSTMEECFAESKIKEFNLAVPSPLSNYNRMFDNATNLKTVNLKVLTNNSISCSYMFYKCSKLETINFNSGVIMAKDNIDCTSMFEGCSSIRSIQTSETGTDPAIFIVLIGETDANFTQMFKMCTSLQQVSAVSFNGTKSLICKSMFENCSSLPMHTIESFTATNNVDFSNMYKGCSTLTSVVIGNINASSINTSTMFENCRSLRLVNIGDITTTDQGNISFEATNMFKASCAANVQDNETVLIQIGRINSFNINMNEAFYESNVKSIVIEEVNADTFILNKAFYSCEKLVNVVLSKSIINTLMSMDYMLTGPESSNNEKLTAVVIPEIISENGIIHMEKTFGNYYKNLINIVFSNMNTTYKLSPDADFNIFTFENEVLSRAIITMPKDNICRRKFDSHEESFLRIVDYTNENDLTYIDPETQIHKGNRPNHWTDIDSMVIICTIPDVSRVDPYVDYNETERDESGNPRAPLTVRNIHMKTEINTLQEFINVEFLQFSVIPTSEKANIHDIYEYAEYVYTHPTDPDDLSCECTCYIRNATCTTGGYKNVEGQWILENRIRSKEARGNEELMESLGDITAFKLSFYKMKFIGGIPEMFAGSIRLTTIDFEECEFVRNPDYPEHLENNIPIGETTALTNTKTDMNGLFYRALEDCPLLTSISFTPVETKIECNDFGNMCTNCPKLQSIDFMEVFDSNITGKTIRFANAFANCTGLNETVDFSKVIPISASGVLNCYELDLLCIFCGCTSIKNIINFPRSIITDMHFNQSAGATSTTNVYLRSAFSKCSKLENIVYDNGVSEDSIVQLPEIETIILDMQKMFVDSYKIKHVQFNSITSAAALRSNETYGTGAITATSMFEGCSGMRLIDYTDTAIIKAGNTCNFKTIFANTELSSDHGVYSNNYDLTFKFPPIEPYRSSAFNTEVCNISFANCFQNSKGIKSVEFADMEANTFIILQGMFNITTFNNAAYNAPTNATEAVNIKFGKLSCGTLRGYTADTTPLFQGAIMEKNISGKLVSLNGTIEIEEIHIKLLKNSTDSTLNRMCYGLQGVKLINIGDIKVEIVVAPNTLPKLVLDDLCSLSSCTKLTIGLINSVIDVSMTQLAQKSSCDTISFNKNKPLDALRCKSLDMISAFDTCFALKYLRLPTLIVAEESVNLDTACRNCNNLQWLCDNIDAETDDEKKLTAWEIRTEKTETIGGTTITSIVPGRVSMQSMFEQSGLQEFIMPTISNIDTSGNKGKINVRLMIANCSNLAIADFRTFSFMEHLIQYVYEWGHDERTFVDDIGITHYVGWYYKYENGDYQFVENGEIGRNFDDDTVPHEIPSDDYYNPSVSGILLFNGSVNNLRRVYLRKSDYVEYGVNKEDKDVTTVGLIDTVIANIRVKIAYNGDYRSVVSEGNEVYSAISRNIRYSTELNTLTNTIYYGDKDSNIIETIEQFKAAITPDVCIWTQTDIGRLCTITLTNKIINSVNKGLESILITLKNNEETVLPRDIDGLLKKYKFVFQDCEFKNGLQNLFEQTKYVIAVDFNNCQIHKIIEVKMNDGSTVYQLFNPSVLTEAFIDSTSIESVNFNCNPIVCSNISYMFKGCVNLVSIDLEKIYLTKSVDMSYLFDSCTKLTTVKWPTLQPYHPPNEGYNYGNDLPFTGLDMKNMFSNTRNFKICNFPSRIKFLKSLDPFDESGVDGVILDVSNMFYMSQIDTINIHEINMNTLISELRAVDWINNCESVHYVSVPSEMEEYDKDTSKSTIKMIVPAGSEMRGYTIDYDVENRIPGNIVYLTFHNAPLLINTEEAFIRYAIEHCTTGTDHHNTIIFDNVNIKTKISMKSVEQNNLVGNPFFNSSTPYHLIYTNTIVSEPITEMFKNSANAYEFVMNNCQLVLEEDDLMFDDMFNSSTIKAVTIEFTDLPGIYTMRRMFQQATQLQTVRLRGINCKDFTSMFQQAEMTLSPYRIDLSRLTATVATSSDIVIMAHMFELSNHISEMVWPTFSNSVEQISLQSAFESSSISTLITRNGEEEELNTLPLAQPSIYYNFNHCFYKNNNITKFVIPDIECNRIDFSEMFGSNTNTGYVTNIEIGKLTASELNMQNMLHGCLIKLLALNEIVIRSTDPEDVNLELNFRHENLQQIKGVVYNENYKVIRVDDVEKRAFIEAYNRTASSEPISSYKVDKEFISVIESKTTSLVYYIDTGKREIYEAHEFGTYTNEHGAYEILEDGTYILKMNNFVIHSSFSDPLILMDGIDSFIDIDEANGYRIYFTNCEFPDGLPRMFEGFDKLISVSFKSVTGEDGNNDVGDPSTDFAKNSWYHTFENCPRLQTVDLALTAARLPIFESAEKFAYNCPLLTSADLSNFTFSKSVDWNSAFENDELLVIVKLPLFKDTTSVNLSNMFKKCSSLSEVTPKNDSKLSGPIDCSYMFSECMSLKKISSTGNKFMLIESIDTHDKLNFKSIFYNCISLTQCTMDNSNIGHEEVRFTEAFSGCTTLKSFTFPILTSLRSNSNIYLERMFYGCSSLLSLNLSTQTLAGDIDMSYMCSGCGVLQSFSFPILDQENLQSLNLTRTFYNCRSLKNIIFANDIIAQYDVNLYEAFRGCGFDTYILINITSISGSIDLTKTFRMCSNLKHLTIQEIDFAMSITLSKIITKCPSIESLTMPKNNLVINEFESDYYMIVYEKGDNEYKEQIPYKVDDFEETTELRTVYFSGEIEPEEEEEEYPDPPEPPAPIEPTVINTIDEFIAYARQPGHYNTRTIIVNGVPKQICIVTFNTCIFNEAGGPNIKLDGHIEELPGYTTNRAYRFLFSNCSFPNGLPEMFEFTSQVSLVRLDDRCVVNSENGDAFRETFFDCNDLATVRIECNTNNKNSMNMLSECPGVNIVDMTQFHYSENMILANLCYNDIKLEEYEWPTYSDLEKVDLRNMFYNCRNLLYGNIPVMTSSEYIYANNMYENSGITKLEIPSLSAPTIDLSELVKNASNLTTLEIRTINADNIITSGMLDNANSITRLTLPLTMIRESEEGIAIVNGTSIYRIPLDIESYEIMGDIIIIRFSTIEGKKVLDNVTKSIFLAREMQILSRLRKLQVAYATTDDRLSRQIMLEEITEIENTIKYMKAHNQWVTIHEYITRK